MLLGVVEENNEEPITVNETKLPLQMMFVFKPIMLVQLMLGDIGKTVCDRSLIHSL